MDDNFYPAPDAAQLIVSKCLESEEFSSLMGKISDLVGEYNIIELLLGVSNELLMIAGPEITEQPNLILQANAIANDVFSLLAEKAQIPSQILIVVLSAMITKITVKSVSDLGNRTVN